MAVWMECIQFSFELFWVDFKGLCYGDLTLILSAADDWIYPAAATLSTSSPDCSNFCAVFIVFLWPIRTLPAPQICDVVF